MLVALFGQLEAVRRFLLDPIRLAAWSDWRAFWQTQIFDDRFLVIYFLPLLPLLLLVPQRWLRHAIILSSLLFMGYVFGVLYVALWLLTCLFLHWLAERFAVECRRTDVLRAGPPLAAGAIIGGWYALTMALDDLRLPVSFNGWLLEHLPWVFPLGARGLSWEPRLARLHHNWFRGEAPQLFHALFWDVHIVGTAYLAIRMLHYFSEIRRDTLPGEQRSRLNFLAYVCYAPALIQGPIERFAEFHRQIDTCRGRRSLRDATIGLLRIAMGVSKSIIATLYFHPVLWYRLGLGHTELLWKHPEKIGSFWLLYFAVFLIIFNLYLEFSGYCDVAIGMSRVLGYRQIENFRMPWLATSLRDFWRRWHISLSFILRDYVYIPLGGNRRHTLRNLLITFFLIGIWHRLVPQVGAWGLLMGLMVWVNQRWARWMKRLEAQPSGLFAGIRRAVLRLRPLPTIAGWLLTQHAFVFSLLVFFGGLGGVNVACELVRRVSVWLVGGG